MAWGPGAADDCGATAIHLAAARLRPQLVARLARGQSSSIDARGRTPLHYVVTGLLTTTRRLRPRTPAQREAANAEQRADDKDGDAEAEVARLDDESRQGIADGHVGQQMAVFVQQWYYLAAARHGCTTEKRFMHEYVYLG